MSGPGPVTARGARVYDEAKNALSARTVVHHPGQQFGVEQCVSRHRSLDGEDLVLFKHLAEFRVIAEVLEVAVAAQNVVFGEALGERGVDLVERQTALAIEQATLEVCAWRSDQQEGQASDLVGYFAIEKTAKPIVFLPLQKSTLPSYDRLGLGACPQTVPND